MKSSLIFYSVTDNHYCPLLASLINSLGINMPSDINMIYYIVEDHVTNNSKTKIDQSNTFQNIEIRWVPLKEALPTNARIPKDRSSWPGNLYGRLFPELFIKEREKIVCYLDVDLIVNKNISTLFSTHLNAHQLMAAVKDSRIQQFSNRWGGIRNYKELGFNGNEPYFNTGLLLIDFEKWKLDNYGLQVINIIQQNIKKAVFPDQYGLNIIMHDKWKELPEDYNFFADKPCKNTPSIYHYIGIKPIYKPNDSSELAYQTFLSYYKNTSFYSIKQKSIINLYFRKMKNRLLKAF